MDHEFLVDGEAHKISLEIQEGRVVATIEGRRMGLDAARLSGHTVSLLAAGKSYRARVACQGRKIFVAIGANQFCLEAPEPGGSSRFKEGAAGKAEGTIKAPMPGMVIKVNVAEGDAVSPGDSLAVVEAMKMEHEMRAATKAIVAKVHVKAGQQVDAFQPLVELKIIEP
jgi:acetyl/propionyl-CoA carboxylase alpha subunit